MEAKADRIEKQKSWRQQRGEVSDDSDENEDSDHEDKSDSSSEEDSDGDAKAKGVESLIEVENPNRVPKKKVNVNTLGANWVNCVNYQQLIDA